MASYKTLDDADLAGKRVLVRVDLNVPMRDGQVTDLNRLEAIKPTVTELTEKGAAVLLISHFGRPKGQVVPEMSLRPVVASLEEVLGTAVSFCDDITGDTAASFADALSSGEVGLLENLRFDPGEEANDPDFAAQLASLAELYVDDAFSCAHRAHASTDGIAQLLPAFAGRLLEKEISALTQALETPERPVMAIVGGNKISTKLDVLLHLIEKVDHLVVGGAMANTFLLAQGIDMGRSLAETDMVQTANEVITAAHKAGCKVVLPTDGVVADGLEDGANHRTVPVNKIPSDQMMLDVGPDSVSVINDLLGQCKTLVWNGPLGAFEFPPFDQGTKAVASAAADFTQDGKLMSIAGGGDTIAALATADAVDRFSYVSTAGGAFLEWLEGRTLPGIAALTR